MNFVLKDTELSDGVDVYQPLTGQTSFLSRSICPRLSSTENVALTSSGSDWKLTYGSNKDLLKLDQVEMLLNDYVLLKNQTTASQNGIYRVTNVSNSGYYLLTKQTATSDGSVIFVREGWQNNNTYYLKSTVSSNQSFTQTVVQKKYVAYNSNSPSIQASIRYSA